MTASPLTTGPAATLGRKTYALLALGFFALALYGSLVPFQFRPVSWEAALARWRQIPWFPDHLESRSDFVANILLFIPLAYLMMATLCVDRPWWAGILAAPAVVVFCCALAVGIEFTQIYFPPRTVSMNDILAETAGGLIGTAAWLAVGQRVTRWARGLWAAWGARNLAARLLPGYLAFLALVHLMPLDLTISPVEIYHKYRQGRIILVPFASPVEGRFELFGKLLWQVAYYAPLGALLAALPTTRRPGVRRTLAIGFAVAGLNEFLQLFVYTRHADVNDVLTGGFAVLAGWWVAGRVRRAFEAGSADAALSGRRGVLLGSLLCGWAALLAVIAWQPFEVITDLGLVRHRLASVSPIPFADLYQGSEYHAWDQVLHKTLLFLPVGGLIAWGASEKRYGIGLAIALLSGLVLATVLEAGQLFVHGRYASVTDILVETNAAVWGFVLGRRVYHLLSTADVAGGTRREFCR
jgi:VanZ family protein